MWWHGGAGLTERSERESLSAVATHDVLAHFRFCFDDLRIGDSLLLDVKCDVHFIPDWNLGPSGVLDIAACADNECIVAAPLQGPLEYTAIRLLRLEKFKGSIRGRRERHLRQTGGLHPVKPQ